MSVAAQLRQPETVPARPRPVALPPSERDLVPVHPALMALMKTVPVQAFVGPRGTMVHMFTAGDGAPILAVHASGMQGQMWGDIMPCLEKDFRLHAPDLYGYGRSEPLPVPQRMTLDDNAALIGTLLRRFDRPVHMIGHAFGGAVALRAALENADRLCSLTLYEPMALHLLKPEYEGHAPAQRQIEALAGDMRGACLRGHTHEAARVFFDYCHGEGAFDAMNLLRRNALASHAPRLCLDINMAFNARQSLGSYRSLKVPTLLLSGARSPGSLRLPTERLAGALPLVRHAVLPELGHFAPASHPEAFGRVILPFLNACERAARPRAA